MTTTGATTKHPGRLTYNEIEAMTEGHDRPMAKIIELTALKINSAEERIASLAEMVRDTLDRVERSLRNCQNLNSLGELQRTPAELDQAITARQAGWEMMRHLPVELPARFRAS